MHPFDDDTICDSRLKPRVNLFGSLPTTDTPPVPGLTIAVLELMVTLRAGIVESRVEGRRLDGRDPRRDSRRVMTPVSCQWCPDSLRDRLPEARRDSWREIRLSPELLVGESLLKRRAC